MFEMNEQIKKTCNNKIEGKMALDG